MEQDSISTRDASREMNYKEWIFFSDPSKSACTFQSVITTGYPAQEHDVPANRQQWQPGSKYCTVQEAAGHASHVLMPGPAPHPNSSHSSLAPGKFVRCTCSRGELGPILMGIFTE